MTTFVLAICSMLGFYCILLMVIKNNGGIKYNIPECCIFSIYFLYFTVNPIYAVLTERTKLFSYDSFENLGYVLFIYLLVFIFTLLGFLLGKQAKPNKIYSNEVLIFDINFARVWLVLGLLSIIVWAILSGYGLRTLFLVNLFSGGKSDFMIHSELNYLKQLFLFSVVGLIFAFNSKMRKQEIIIWFLIVFLVTVGFGFRYIIIILAMALFFFSISVGYRNGRKSIASVKVIFAGIALLIFVLAVGQLRNYIKS